MKTVFAFIAIFVAGLVTAAEGATNGLVSKSAGSLYFALVVAFAVSSLLLLAAMPFLPFRANWDQLRTLPWYAWVGGVYTLMTIGLAAWATPKIGAGPSLVAAILAECSLGLVIDHFGAFGLEQSPITWLKVAGVAVMLGGAVMVGAKG